MACSGYQGTQTVERATTNYIKRTTRHEEETQRIETAFLQQTTGVARFLLQPQEFKCKPRLPYRYPARERQALLTWT